VKPYGGAPIYGAASGCGCGGCCDTCGDCCEESWGSKLKGRLKGMFSRKSCDDCCSTCDTCDTCEGKGWWGRLRKSKHDCDDCCGCGSYLGGAVLAPVAPGGVPAKQAEQIPAPSGAKELPKGDNKTGQLLTPRPIAPASTLSLGQ
jgi:hypothetical protein